MSTLDEITKEKQRISEALAHIEVVPDWMPIKSHASRCCTHVAVAVVDRNRPSPGHSSGLSGPSPATGILAARRTDRRC